MTQQLPELHGSGYFGSGPEYVLRDPSAKREMLIRSFLPLAAAISDAPQEYANFMVQYIGDSDPILRQAGAVPRIVRKHHADGAVEKDYSCTFFAGASQQGDLLSVRGVVWAQRNNTTDHFVALSDGDHKAQEPKILSVATNDPAAGTGMWLRMMSERTARNWPPDMVPDRMAQWSLNVRGEQPETREAVLSKPTGVITFYPIDALHEAILRIRGQATGEGPSSYASSRHLSLVHSENWPEYMTQ